MMHSINTGRRSPNAWRRRKPAPTAGHLSPWIGLRGYRHTVGMARHWHFLDFVAKLLSAMRYGFGGHAEKTATAEGGPG